jgi:hypothetical protein
MTHGRVNGAELRLKPRQTERIDVATCGFAAVTHNPERWWCGDMSN